MITSTYLFLFIFKFFWNKLYLFFPVRINDEFEIGEILTLDEPLVEGSISSLELSGIIIIKFFFLLKNYLNFLLLFLLLFHSFVGKSFLLYLKDL